MLIRMLQHWKLRKFIKQGLQVADDCRLASLPDFGSEPYLVSIGRHVAIAARVSFITHDGGTTVFREQPKYRDVIRYGRIVIHDNCMIGYGAILMPGVKIGPNAIVASGSIVTKDVPPGTVAGGVPARTLMSLEQFADKCLAETPPYDRAAYKNDKVAELLRLFPRPW